MTIEVTEQEYHLILQALLMQAAYYSQMKGSAELELGAKLWADEMFALRSKLEGVR